MKLYIYILVAALTVVLAGCDLEESKFNDLKFDNASRYNVQVIPLTSEWEGFNLAPGETKEFGDIDNPDYTWEPLDKVEVGVSSTDRDVIFVDRGDVYVPPVDDPIIIVVTNNPSP